MFRLNVETKKVVAIKILNLDTLDDEVKDVQQEITLLSKLTKSGVQNIIHYHGSFLAGSKLWIIMDFCSGGSVRTLLKAGRIEERYSAVIMREMLVALQYIHKEDIIHRDIKAANVLISRGGGVQLCDFGVAAQLSTAQLKRTSMIGTPYWMAPEVIKEGSSYNQKADVWSLGITLYEIITGSPPYADQDIKRAVYLIPRSKPTRLEGSQYSPALKEFIAMCLDEQPDARPIAEDLLKTRFIKNTRSISTSILKDLITRYQQWRENNKHVRDSFMASTGHGASFSDDEDDDSSSFDWDFDENADIDNTPSNSGIRQNSTSSFFQSEASYSHTEFSDSAFSTSNAPDIKSPMESFSQEPTFRAADNNYFSQLQSQGNTMSTPLSQIPTPSFNMTEKHPLLDIFEEESDELSYTPIKRRDNDPAKDTRDVDNKQSEINMSLPPPINNSLNSFTPPISSLQTSSQVYTPMEIEIPSISALSSHPMLSAAPTPSLVGGNMMATGPQFPLVNPSLAHNPSITCASTPNLSTLLKASAPQSKISQTSSMLQQKTNTTENSSFSFVSNKTKTPLTSSASEINISASYTHQNAPMTTLSQHSRQPPPSKRTLRRREGQRGSNSNLSKVDSNNNNESTDQDDSGQLALQIPVKATSMHPQPVTRSKDSLERPTKAEVQQYQQQQYNQQLQHLQQQQLKATLSTTGSAVMVPVSVPVPQDIISSTSATMDVTNAIKEIDSDNTHGRNTTRNNSEGKERSQTSNKAMLSSKLSSFNGDTLKDEEYLLQGSTKNEDSIENSRKLSATGSETSNSSAIISKTLKNGGRSYDEQSSSLTNASLTKPFTYKAPEKLQFTPLTAFNCDILLDAVSKEAVVNELSFQLGNFVSALDVIEKQLSSYIID